MDHQIFANFSITINIEKSLKKWTFMQKLGACFRKTPKILTVALLKIVVWIKWIMYIFYSKHFFEKPKNYWSYWYIGQWMMVMDSIKFWSPHLMDDGDGHHNYCIDGDGDGHHLKGDGRHVWYLPSSKVVTHDFSMKVHFTKVFFFSRTMYPRSTSLNIYWYIHEGQKETKIKRPSSRSLIHKIIENHSVQSLFRIGWRACF